MQSFLISKLQLPIAHRPLERITILYHLKFVFVILACVAAPAVLLANEPPIHIAAIFSETGIAAPHNLPLIDMTRLAVEELNKHGGVLDRQIELTVIDNTSTPIGSAMAAQKAIALGVTAVIGAHWSSHSLAIAPLLQEAGIPMISPASTNPEVTHGRNYVFRVCFIDSFQGLAMARFAHKELEAKTAAVITNIDEDYSTTLGRFFSTAFVENGGAIVQEAGYRGNATDFSAIIEELVSKKPEVVYLPGYSRDSGLFIRQAVKQGLQTTFLGGDAWDEIEKYAGNSMEGSYQSAPWHPSVPFTESEEMKRVYRETHGKAIENVSVPLAWDAVMLLADAITRAGKTDRNAIRQALAATTDFQGATGTITFDGDGNPLNKAIIVIGYYNGKRLFGRVISPTPGSAP